jgi:hypothetical protein
MTDDYQNRPGVNLEELERQLRVASRAHGAAVAAASTTEQTPQKTVAIPDIEALRRDFGLTRSTEQTSQPYSSQDDFQPAQPPAFLRQPVQSSPPPAYTNPFDDRFPKIDRKQKKGSAAFRAMFSGIVAFLMLAFGYFFYSGKLALSVSVAPDQKNIPVIKADSNPVKVVPDAAGADDAAQPGAELFGKKGGEITTPPTTRNSSEAPVDVNAVVKGAGSKAAPLVPGMGDPKMVRTVTIRPDGTLIGEQPPQTALPSSNSTPIVATPPAAAMTQEAPPTLVPLSSSSQPLPTKPAALVQPVETAQAMPSAPLENPTIDGLPVPLPLPRPADLGADETKSGAPADALEALVAAATTAEPIKTADDMPLQQVIPPVGDYAVQFGASPVEADANSMMAKLKGPLAELLGDHPLSVVKGESNGKTVFRVRALGYARDEAAATCATAGAVGTKCFIAKN